MSEMFRDESAGKGKFIRGRIPQQVQLQILSMHQQGIPPETISEATSRSPASICKVLDGGLLEDSEACEPKSRPSPDPIQDWGLDEVVDFLAEFPEAALEELLQLARLTREQSNVRNLLAIRLSQV